MFQTVFLILQSHKWSSCLTKHCAVKPPPKPSLTTERRGRLEQIFILKAWITDASTWTQTNEITVMVQSVTSQEIFQHKAKFGSLLCDRGRFYSWFTPQSMVFLTLERSRRAVQKEALANICTNWCRFVKWKVWSYLRVSHRLIKVNNRCLLPVYE